VFAQLSPQDCAVAQLVCDDFNVPFSYINVGTQNEIDTMNSSCLSLGEENSVWFKFFAATAGQLIFEIIPNNFNDDYDYACTMRMVSIAKRCWKVLPTS
jgi:hypothetical protein